MTEQMLDDNISHSSVREIVKNFNSNGDNNNSGVVPIQIETTQQRILTDENSHSSISSTVDSRKRTLPSSTFSLEIGALILVFMLTMVLVAAFREDQTNLRSTMQVVYAYIYFVPTLWMIWCIYDILKFRRKWMKYMLTVDDESDLTDIIKNYPHDISYFHDVHNTGGLFMRVGAGILCMGSLLLTVIELARAIETLRTHSYENDFNIAHFSQSVYITKTITFILRFIFHCVQFTFLFRYGNIIINRYHFIAKFGLIHLIIANFCTWFEAIVIETLEELHRHAATVTTTAVSMAISVSPDANHLLKASPSESSNSNGTTEILDFIQSIQLTVGVYLYPCLIEYSLISVTVFYIMWRNIGKKENRLIKSFNDHHIFVINCSGASAGLAIGGILFLLTISSLIPVYILDPPISTLMTRLTELILLVVSFLTVCLSFFYTTKLYYDPQAHVDIFDQILILVTTLGDFAYSFFSLFASIFIVNYTTEHPRIIEILVGVLSLFETVFQSAFILDALKRRTITKKEKRKKPGRELITALLLINLAIWLHDSFSAKKVKLSPLQSEFYDPKTWSIVHAFTSPLAIFYRFHSSVCLADIWQEVYRDH